MLHPRSLFFITLPIGAVCAPVTLLAWLFGWALPTEDPDAVRWQRRLGWLAGLDVVLLAFFIVASTAVPAGEPTNADVPAVVEQPVAPRPIIGVEGPPESTDPAEARWVRPDGPAAAAGIVAGDVVVAVNGVDTPSFEHLKDAISGSPLGESVAVQLADGRELTVEPMAWKPYEPPSIWSPTGAVRPVGDLLPMPAPALLIVLGALVAIAVGGRSRGATASTPAWLVGALLAMTVAPALVGWGVARALGGSSTGGHMLTVVLAVVFGTIAGAGLLTRVERRPTLWGQGAWVHGPPAALAMVGGAWRVAALTHYVTLLLPAVQDEQNVLDGVISGAVPTLWVPVIVLLASVAAPVYEELLFRGFLLSRYLEWLGPWAAIALSSLIFAAMHSQYRGGLLVVVWVACVFGWARWKTGGLALPMLLHAGWNGLNSVLAIGARLASG